MLQHKNTNDFLSLIQDEKFIELVRSGNKSRQSIEEMIRQLPGQKKDILYAIEFIRINLYNKVQLSQADYDQILKNIQDHGHHKQNRRFIQSPFFRIAAAILIIISISAVIFYQQSKVDKLAQFAQSHESVGQEGMIVLSDGSKKALEKNESLIEYNAASGEVIVKARDAEQRIENKTGNKDVALNQVVVPFGRRHKVLLSDGTLVQLNAGSRLSFPATFTGKIREVYLEGEGLFEVSKNQKVPFIVKTRFIDIRVLGTTFNVSAYTDENVTSAVLVEGSVNVMQNNKSFFSRDNTTLTPGQGYFFSKVQKTHEVRNVDINDFVLWKEGLYQFSDMPLSDIIARVRKYYNQKVQIEGPELAGTIISGKLVLSDDFNVVMQYLSKTIEGNFELTGEGIYVLKK